MDEYLYRTYMFNVIKEYEGICIEVRSCLDEELQMTIDAKKIISKLRMPLEDEEWENLKNMKLGALIRETYDDIIISVGDFTASATRILKSKITEDMWEGCRFKRDVWDYYYYVSYSEEFEPLILSRLKTNCKENYYVPIQ